MQTTAPTAESFARMRLEFARLEAREYQRRLMQGLGRSIVSFEDANGYRFVAVGKEIRWSKAWRTFPDFLFDYIKHVFTHDWGNAELKKPESERHPLLGWYRKVCDFQRSQLGNASDGIYQANMTGVVKAYLGLANDLYLCAHNAELPPLLVARLRNPKTFEGALYEAYVIGNLAKAGFHIEFEDEIDSSRSHCELTATHQQTGRKFSVEAKAVTSESTRSGSSTSPPRIRGKLYDALSKRADHDRLIFIEINRVEFGPPGAAPDWVQSIDTELVQAEQELTVAGQPAPPAYVMVTNRAFMHALDSEQCPEMWLACGYKIPDFASRTDARSVLELVAARERHIELQWLRKALQTHSAIPNTFDERVHEDMASNAQMPRLQIGATYMVPDERGQDAPGILTDASVLEAERVAYGIYQLPDGRYITCTSPLSDAELAIYRRSPNTFFGIIKEVGRTIQEPLDCYDFLWETYSKTVREKLLELTRGWPDQPHLATLNQEELARHYCACMAEQMWQKHVQALGSAARDGKRG